MCFKEPSKPICEECSLNNIDTSLLHLQNQKNILNKTDSDLESICYNCVKHYQNKDLFLKHSLIGLNCCESLDCQVFYERNRVVTKLEDKIEALNLLEYRYLDW